MTGGTPGSPSRSAAEFAIVKDRVRLPTSTSSAHRMSWLLAATLAVGCSKQVTGPTPVIPDPPQITCPSPQPVLSTSGQGMPVTFTPTVTLGADPVATACTPASGSVFAVGTTPVSCTATDARQRTASCSFNVVVQPPPRVSLTRFVAFGDSITRGEDGNTTLTSFDLSHFLRLDYPTIILLGREYPTVLQQLLATRYTTQSMLVVNAGNSGERAGDSTTFSRFTAISSSRAYDVVLLMEGTNDIYGGSGGNPLGIPTAIAGLRRMIRDGQSRGMRVFLATVPPMNPAGARGALGYQTVPALNAEIRTLALAEGVPLVDVFAAFNGNFSLLSIDGLHPNAEGFAVVARRFYDVIRERLEVTPLDGGIGGAAGVGDAVGHGWPLIAGPRRSR